MKNENLWMPYAFAWAGFLMDAGVLVFDNVGRYQAAVLVSSAADASIAPMM
jgi:hypothetical protein